MVALMNWLPHILCVYQFIVSNSFESFHIIIRTQMHFLSWFFRISNHLSLSATRFQCPFKQIVASFNKMSSRISSKKELKCWQDWNICWRLNGRIRLYFIKKSQQEEFEFILQTFNWSEIFSGCIKIYASFAY